MASLKSLSPGANVAVIGASGGIGAEFTRQLSVQESVGRVHALSRDCRAFSSPKVLSGRIDLMDEESIRAAATTVAASSPVDLLIIATGILHDGSIQPEKSIAEIDQESMLDVIRVNTVGPALVAKHFLPRMRRDARSVFAVLSARVGSIADNRLGGWASYRTSKAALNMLLKTAAIEQARRLPQSIVVGLHPGTVDTDLSKPFQRRVPERQLFTPAYSVSRLLQVIDSLDAANSGRCLAWDGQVVEY